MNDTTHNFDSKRVFSKNTSAYLKLYSLWKSDSQLTLDDAHHSKLIWSFISEIEELPSQSHFDSMHITTHATQKSRQRYTKTATWMQAWTHINSYSASIKHTIMDLKHQNLLMH